MIKDEQPFVEKRMNKLNSEKWVTSSFLFDQSRQWASTWPITMKRIAYQLLQVVESQRRKYDVMHCGASLANGFEFARQRVRGGHFVVAVGADQHQVFHVGMRQQILHQIQRSRVEPLQIVEEQGEGTLPRECADKSAERQLEAALRILWRERRNRLLLSDDQLQFRDEIHHELTIRTERLADGVAPTAELFLVPRQEWTDEALEGLREGRIRDVSLVLVEFA